MMSAQFGQWKSTRNSWHWYQLQQSECVGRQRSSDLNWERDWNLNQLTAPLPTRAALLIVKSMFHLLHTCGAFGKGGHTMSVQNPGITIDHWQYFLAYLTQCTEQPPKSDNLATRATLLIVKLLFHLVATYFCLLSINFVSNFYFDLVKQNKHPRDATQAN